MKVYIYSRSDIQKLIDSGIPNNVAIVSFSDTNDDFVEFPKGTNVFQVAFYDIRPYTIETTEYDSVLPEAKQIAEFVHENILNKKDIS